ncbi:hypothetical protein [Cognatishimia maritima]|uniref:Uncharacterized protein n=1 Tax=Cognatishimia maritima TaxID=870908 RepID=A0A1M5QXX8_9RHOB|nr:hypothetical protein [Cognatishimia maritima]SHH18620.1 hypothetical protein SAMN04488044_2132 [Cognatishimia maritima]
MYSDEEKEALRTLLIARAEDETLSPAEFDLRLKRMFERKKIALGIVPNEQRPENE